MKRALSLVVALAFVLVAGCQSEPVDDGGSPMIRTLSAAIANAPLDVCVNGQLSIMDIDTGARTAHSEADTQRFEMATGPTGTPCDQTTPVTGLENIDLTPERFSTVVILPDGVSAIQLADDNTPLPAGEAKIRVINMCEDCENVTVTDQDDNVLFTNVAFNNVAEFGYENFAAGTYDFIIKLPDAESTGRIIEGFVIEEGTTYTIFVFGRMDGDAAAFNFTVIEDLRVGIETTSG
ncbi:MAG: DUF4397 domain-containing protein [Phycisphaerae bacterium]|nr:DUF4397 domain-containing protein [Phycisphaerales bacterium]